MAVGFLLNTGHLEPYISLLYFGLTVVSRNDLSGRKGRSMEYKSLFYFIFWIQLFKTTELNRETNAVQGHWEKPHVENQICIVSDA